MVEMMQGVTRGGGTAPGASAIGHPVAGKTGTVNDQTDVWFIGYTPTICRRAFGWEIRFAKNRSARE